MDDAKKIIVERDKESGLFIASRRVWFINAVADFHQLSQVPPGINQQRRRELASLAGAAAFNYLNSMGGMAAAW